MVEFDTLVEKILDALIHKFLPLITGKKRYRCTSPARKRLKQWCTQ